MATTALVTGVLTTTAATVFNGGFAANAASTITTADNLSGLIVASTDADANTGPTIQLKRDSSTTAANDLLGNLIFVGENNNDEATVYANIGSQNQVITNGSESGRFFINTIIGGTEFSRFFADATGTVINENSRDLDFKIKSDGNDNMLFVDGGNNRIGIGTATPAQFVDIQNAASFVVKLLATGNNTRSQIQVQAHTSAGADLNMILGSFGDGARGELSMNTNHPLRIYTNNNPNKGIEVETDGDLNVLDGNLIIGTAGHGIDFSAQTATSASGASATSELFDHYEEGTWTPGLANFSVSGTLTVNGRYTRIGRQVTVQGSVSAATSIAFGTSCLISGFPFAGSTFVSETISRVAGTIVGGSFADLPSSNHSAACFTDPPNSRAFLSNFTTLGANEPMFFTMIYFVN